MTRVTALVLRRMRPPLIALIAAYAVSMLGLVLVPGVDDQGRAWHMDLFHAFYFVSYMASTIGFGELPYAFSDAQRMWVTVGVYVTVITWLYAIGTILSLIQDRAFQQTLHASRFAREVRRLREPFYLVCGYGGTGTQLVRSLAELGIRVVVIDVRRERINDLETAELPEYVPGLIGDAGIPRHLEEAGLQARSCAGVVALTDSDHVNLQIAITSKLLNPRIPVICRAETHDFAANMASFGTEHIVNPFEAFADHLAMALHAPDMYVLFEWLTGMPRTHLGQVAYPPHGTWVLCGYGRLGKAVRRRLQAEGVEIVVVEADPEKTDCHACVVGRGTEAHTLREARVGEAVGIVAGTNDDANNLSILMTAQELNPRLFFVGRQNDGYNEGIFRAVHADLVMQRSHIIAQEILALITTPMLARFLRLARGQESAWAAGLVDRLDHVVGALIPDFWTVRVSSEGSPAVCGALHEGLTVRLEHIMRDSRERQTALPCIPLLLCRGPEEVLRPAPETVLAEGDELLFCGAWGAEGHMAWTLRNHNALVYIITGDERPDGLVWRWLSGRAG